MPCRGNGFRHQEKSARTNSCTSCGTAQAPAHIHAPGLGVGQQHFLGRLLRHLPERRLKDMVDEGASQNNRVDGNAGQPD